MSDVTNTDPWQMIYDKASELADSLFHELPKSEFDALDLEKLVYITAKKIAERKVDIKKDWVIIIKPVNNKNKIDEVINEHFDVALRQAVFAMIRYEYDVQKIRKTFPEVSQQSMLMVVGEEMLNAFACAQRHATAWRILKGVRDKSYEMRSQSANQIKAEKKEERELLLRSLIESSLKRLRPAGGWRSLIIAAQIISKDLAEMAETFSLPLTSDEGELTDKVQLMIWKEPRLRKAYNENSKHPLEEPTKVRNVGGVNVAYSRDSWPDK